ncbi:MAG TPA: L-rhamnose mutarotase [Bacteroidales bacterium]|nr:L-rhamnose mutarotase [Bacteroidales bacterium]
MIKGITFLLLLIAAISCNLKQPPTETGYETEKTIDYVYTCNLKNNPDSIARYKHYHTKEGAWPEVIKTYEASGATSVKIYLKNTRLVMIVSLPESLSWEDFSERYAEAYPEKMKEWGELMAPFQTPPPFANEGETWVQMEQIFEFEKNLK